MTPRSALFQGNAGQLIDWATPVWLVLIADCPSLLSWLTVLKQRRRPLTSLPSRTPAKLQLKSRWSAARSNGFTSHRLVEPLKADPPL